MATFEGKQITTYKDGGTPDTGTRALGSIFEDEFNRLYENDNALNDGKFDKSGGTITGDTTIDKSLTVKGNLVVEGTSAKIQTTDMDITDRIITLNKGEAGAGVTSDEAGVCIDRGTLGTQFLNWVESKKRWCVGIAGAMKKLITEEDISAGTDANKIAVRDASGKLPGDITGNAASATTAVTCTGNAATATTATSCTGNAKTATTAASCSGNAATATNAGIRGLQNTAIGEYTLASNPTGPINTAIGSNALNMNTTGQGNSAVGNCALYRNNEGEGNTAVGNCALSSCTTGKYNTAVGSYALISCTYSYCTGLGYDAEVTGDNQLKLGNSTTAVYAQSAINYLSDERDKADIKDTSLGLAFINKLRPVDFKWDMREDYRETRTEENKDTYEFKKLSELTHDGTHIRSRYHHGLIAQEVKAVIDNLGIDFGGYQDHSVNGGDDVKSIGYAELIGPMIKAIQELNALVVSLQAKISG